jgi:hypothetical protein
MYCPTGRAHPIAAYNLGIYSLQQAILKKGKTLLCFTCQVIPNNNNNNNKNNSNNGDNTNNSYYYYYY